MKKNRPIANNLFKIMKITLMQLVLAFVFSSMAFANHTYAQPELNQKVTLKIENKQLKKVLSQIETLTKVSFTYIPQVIQADRKVTLSANDESLGDVLQKLLSPLKISFEMVGKKIVLSRVPSLTEVNPNTNNVTQTQVALTVSGKVTDKVDGSGLPGVNIGVKGTAIGTTTGADGSYTLNNIPDNATLVFSFVGYVSQEVAVGNQSTINIILSSDVKTLDEVVVIGYGTQQRKDVTGGVVSLAPKDFNKGIISSPEQLLQGRAAGVQVTPSSGEPGAAININIRGAASIRSGTNPLYVVDGFPLDGGNTQDGGQDYGGGSSSARNPLNFLNPADIESISVLKDASAAAIYGARAANGVIIITTRKGKAGQQTVNFSASTSISNPLRKYKLLNSNDFLSAVTKAGGDISPPTVNGGSSTDWQKEILRTGVSQNYALDFGGGNDNTRYMFSASYLDQQGIIKKSNMNRITARINATHEMFNDRLTLNLNLTASQTKDIYIPNGDNAGAQGNLIGAALQTNPTFPVKSANGSFFTLGGDFRNPVAMLDLIDDNGLTNRILGTFSATLRLFKGLNYKLNLGLDNSIGVRRTAIYPNNPGFSTGTINSLNGQTEQNGLAIIQNRNRGSNLIEHTLNYSEKIGIGTLEALGGFSYQKYENRGSYLQAANFLPDVLKSGVALYDAIPGVNNKDNKSFYAGSDRSQNELQSYFGRLNYNIQDKYILTATVRVDGSSRFGSSNKYGTFPSFAVAWRISKESFMPEGLFDDLKLRASYGLTGNQDYPGNTSKVIYNFDPNNAAANPQNNPNSKIKWEQTKQLGIGLDFALLNNRLTGNIDYFDKGTKDLIYQSFYAQPAAATYKWINLPGNISSKGVEFTLGYDVIKREKFTWQASYNMTYVKTLVTGIGPITTGAVSGNGLSGAYAQEILSGYPVGAFFLRQFGGYDDKGLGIYSNGENLTYSGSAVPKFNYGLNNNFTYGQWNLSLFLTAQTGFYVYNNTANAYFIKGNLNNAKNVTKDVASSSENPANFAEASTRFLEKGDFLRLSNFTLGYNFKIPTNNYIKSLRLNLNGQNVFIITKYSGIDPQVSVNKQLNNVSSSGMDYVAYPSSRTFSIGLNAGF